MKSAGVKIVTLLVFYFISAVKTADAQVSIPASQSICLGSSATLTGVNSGAAWNYVWSPAAGLSATTGRIVSVTPPAAGTYVYSVSMSYYSSFVSAGTATVVVAATTPVLSVVAGSSTACATHPASMTASGAYTYAWAPATALSATTGNMVTSTASVTTTYTVTGTNGCGTSTATQLMTSGAPVITGLPFSGYVCRNSPVVLAPISDAVSYTWSPAEGLSATTGSTVTVNVQNSNVYSVTATAANGCVTRQVAGYCELSFIAQSYAGGSACGCTGYGGPATSAEIDDPAALTVDNSGNLYIADGQYVKKVNASGIISLYAGTGTSSFTGDGGPAIAAGIGLIDDLKTDRNGNLYLIDHTNNRVRMVNASTGIITTVAGNGSTGYSGDGGAATSAGMAPGAIAVDSSGNLYIADMSNNRVRKVNTSGVISTIAGTGVAGYSGDGGPATAAKLNSPGCLAVDYSGNIYVGDGTSITGTGTISAGNKAVRKINTSGIITTVAGSDTAASPAATSPEGLPATSGYLWAITAIAVDRRNNLYIAQFTDYIKEINNYGLMFDAMPTGHTYWNGLALDSMGNVFASSGRHGSSSLVLKSWVGTSNTVTATAAPAIICPGGSAILTGAGAITYSSAYPSSFNYGTYSWSPATALSSTSLATVTASPATTQVYTVTGTNVFGCSTKAVQTINVYTPPSLAIAPSSAVLCSGSSATLTASGDSMYTWSPAASLSASTGASVVAAPIATATYTVTGTIGTCSLKATKTFTVVPSPAISAAVAPASICNGLSASFSASGASTYSWSPAAGLSAATGSVVTGTPTVTTAYVVTGTSAAGCVGTKTVTATVVNQQWKGTVSTAWSNGSNWTCGSVPAAAEDIVIPGATSYTNAPTLNVSSGYAKSLTVGSSAVLTLGSGNTLYVPGVLADSGTVAGDGIVSLNGANAQTLNGNGTISNLTLANSSGAAIDTLTGDTISVTGTLLLTAGTLTTSDKLMLVSGASGNATIGPVTGGAVSGNVVVQQYVPGGRRAYRFIAHPFTSSISLGQIQRYIDITGAGGSANGFTTTTSNAPSAYWYNTSYGNSSLGSDPGWNAFTSTYGTPDSNRLHRYQGMRLFVRGAKGEGLDGSAYSVDAATYRTWGAVNTGTQTVTMIKGAGANEDYNLLGNPYPAITDVGTVISNAYAGGLVAGGAFYVWDPYMNTSGQFVAVAIGSSYFIGPDESFEVRTAANGNALTFAEGNKGTAVSAALMRATVPDDHIGLSIYDTSYHLWDMLQLRFTEQATDNDDSRYDGDKPPSPAPLSFYSLSGDNKKLSLDVRPYFAGKVIPLGLTTSYAQPFIIRAEEASLINGGQVYLHDKLLHTYTLLKPGAEYKFTVTNDAASQGEKRFELAMDTVSTSTQSSDLQVRMLPNPAVSDVTISFTAAAPANTVVRLISIEGISLLTQQLGIQQSGEVVLPLSGLASGIYLVELTSGDHKVMRRLVKE